jgi:serine/threonine protein kinase
VQLYDFGATEDGRLYYVMELLDGLDLDTLVRRHGPLPAERVVHILRQVCSSLQDAHVNGLVHRDIKPANVVVSRAGTTFDFAKVLDFGLVKLDTARNSEDDAVILSTEGAGHSAEGRTADTPGSPTSRRQRLGNDVRNAFLPRCLSAAVLDLKAVSISGTPERRMGRAGHQGRFQP